MLSYHWHQQAVPSQLAASQVWEALFGHLDIGVLLESPASSSPNLARYSILGGSPQQIYTPGLGQVLPCLQKLLDSHPPQDLAFPDLPFTGGWLGWLGYDLAWEIERLPYTKPDSLPFPIAFWYAPQQFAVLDHQTEQLYLAAIELDHLQHMQSRLANYQPAPVIDFGSAATSLQFFPDQATYEQMVAQAQAHIRAGDIFQANLSLRFSLEQTASGWQLYRQLQRINPSPFACYWRTPWGEVISASPERLLSLRSLNLQTRPIAGTRSRSPDLAQDLLLEQELLASGKDCAEHIMLLDLERNDLSKVSRWGSVQVDEFLSVERYSHVMHLVSNVIGSLDTRFTPIQAIAAMFPGGTITGCPKVRCMEIIEQLEPQRRSLFYGSCGYLDWRGDLDLNILIRTLLKSQDQIWGQVGAGIVADSQPTAEWQECLSKAKAQLFALGLSI
ncbi:MAG: anthranilate synthase component I [Pseudanabaenaceae cyanobacterium bins.68]|nr:anthranilate synthase component I [Pseudanabaenaceae cyanobacterium bins.68]